MVKTVLSVNHQGFRDWAIQRLSAIMMAAYTLFILAFIMCHPQLSFNEWHALFSSVSMRIATVLCMAATLYHAWIGTWTVLTDYIKPLLLRLIFNIVILLLLFTLFIWGLFIMGSV